MTKLDPRSQTTRLSFVIRITLAAALILATGVVRAQNPPPGSVGYKPPKRTAGGLNPLPVITSLEIGEGVQVEWQGFQGPYTVKGASAINEGEWESLLTTQDKQATFELDANAAFLQIEGANPNFAGAATCRDCHPGPHSDWLTTTHAEAIESLRAIGQHENPYCLACHTVGYGTPNGFVSEEMTPGLAGVQCENCHGPAANHAANPFDPSVRPLVTVSSVVCGGCHTDAHHPTYDEWELSRHGKALQGLKASGHARDTCLSCHSEDYRYAVAKGLQEVPTVETASLSLECSTCHAPHGSTVEDHLLRQPVNLLCGECHTQGEASLGSSPHHPQFEMLQGIGAYQADGSPLEQPSYHSGIAKACAQCHVVKHSVDSPNEGNPNVTGHTFNPFDESIPEHQAEPYTGCADCHRITPAFELRHRVIQDYVSDWIARINPFLTPGDPSYINPEELSPEDQARHDVARFNVAYVTADKSLGMHNFENVKTALGIAEGILKDLSQPGE